MLEMIRKTIAEILSQWQLTDYFPGLVVRTEPLLIKLSDELYLTKENLILTEVTKDFAPDDKVVLLRVMRGQRYIVLSKVVEK